MNTTNEKKNNGSGVDVNSHAAKNNNNMDSNLASTKTKVEKINPTMSDHQKHVVATNHGGSITSSNSGGVSVKFALPAVVACVEPRMGASSLNENHSGISATTSRCIKSSTANNLSGAASASSGSLSSSSGGSGNKKAPSGSLLKRPPESLQKQNKFSQSSGTSNISNISNSGEDDEAKISNTGMSNKNNNNDRSSGSGSGSGSGSDNNGGATSSSGNAAAVTASATSTANNNTTSSGSGDGSDRSSSGSGAGEGSGSGSGSGPGEYYYAGYGTATSMGGGTASSNNHQAASTKQGPNGGAAAQQPQQAMGMDASSNMPSFSNFQGAPLAASSAAADAGPQVQQQHHRQQQAGGGQLAPPPMNSSTRHVVVGTDEGGLPPPPHAFTSHLRHHHHSRHHRSTTGNNNEGNQHSAALRSPAAPPALSSGIPSAIGGPGYRSGTHHHAQQQRYELRLPPSDEQAVLQRVPRTHATVVAHDLPPPPTSSDAWSSTGSGGSASKSRKRSAAAASTRESSHHNNSSGHPMVASVRLADGGTLDSVDMADGSPSSSDSSTQVIPEKSHGAAMHVTMDDPILRKKMTLKQLSSEAASAPASESKPKTSSNSAMKRKISAMSRMGTSESDNSETEAVGSGSGSGSDEGYNASSERQSGSGSDDGDSSEGDAKKVKVASSAVSNKVGVTVGGSQSNSKRTETSSMSSSVLADFSSVMNEEGTIELNSPSRPDSPRSNSSLSNDGNDMYDANAALEKMNETQIKSDGAARSKRDAAHLAAHLAATSTNKFRKRSKSEEKLASIVHQHPMKSGMSIMEKSLQQKLRSGNHHHYHSQSTGRKMLEKSFLSARRDLSSEAESVSVMSTMKLSMGKTIKYGDQLMKDSASDVYQEPSIYSLGQDIMANVVSYLEPPETHVFLTTPLSKAWLVTYTAPQELWKILCTSKPFYAKLDENECSSDSSTASFPICNDLEMRHLFGRYRLLYSSFVRCMKYLKRLQDDALNGRTPSVINSNQGDIYPFNKNTSLKAYFAKARRLRRSHRPTDGSRSSSDAALSITSPDSGSNGSNEKAKAGQKRASGTARAGKSASANGSRQNNSSSRRLGRSMLTDRLLRPTQAGEVDNVNLPWSCAIYSVVNWMVAFADVEGIQIMCLKCLPYLLEDESQRTTAQRAGLTDSVLRAMVLFPDSIELHTVAFHTLVLLARPLGGNEGMLFHTAMVNTRGIFNNGSSNSKNGIVIMLDSMRRFAHDEILQAMSCWSLVNVALTPLQKSMLVKLGGLTVTSNAMLQHPFNAEVQFRALFALINLVIPTETRPDETEEMREFEREIFEQLGEAGETSEKEMLDASVGQISNLVVVSMKNFCSSEAILNRACLVLHNLSLNEEYHSILLWTPNCYQMLEWCLGNYPHDHVLQQSAGGTIQRLNATLSADEELRARFTHSIRAQQQHSLDLARQEAVVLQEQQQQMMDVS